MSRKTVLRKTVSDAVSTHQDQALSTVMLLLKSYGPAAFLLGEDGEAQTFKVCLGDLHTCTCDTFIKTQELCKHICWVLLCKFSVPRDHEYSFQLGLGERQLLELLQGVRYFHTQRTHLDPSTAAGTLGQPNPSQKAGSVCRKAIEAQDVCPICQEELLQKKQPVSHCRLGCGNSVHISCMNLWANHQNLSGMHKMVKCPLCRQNFSSVKLLYWQMKNSLKLFTIAENETPDKHLGVRCRSCLVFPVTGRCYKCTVCSYLYLCGKCVKMGCHSQHPLASRARRTEQWLLVGEDSSEGPKEATCQPEHDRITAAVADPLSDSILKGLPAFRVTASSCCLDAGQQCRLCLQSFIQGQLVRTLPCFHKFHMDCVDQILRASNSCPLDGYVIYAPTKRTRDRLASSKLASCPSRNMAGR